MTAVSEFSTDLEGAGTPESVWLAAPSLRTAKRWRPVLPRSGRVVVVAPHPDDEILGAGGTVARLMSLGAHHVAVAVTDGEASHHGRAPELREVRPAESFAAAQALGIVPDVTHRLRMEDGRVEARRLAVELAGVLQPDDLVLAPWVCDGHPDHAQVGLGADMACAMRGANLLSYLVWAWHWARPDQLPWHKARRVDLSPRLTARKRGAIRCFRSQIEGPDPVLRPEVITRLTRCFEVLVET